MVPLLFKVGRLDHDTIFKRGFMKNAAILKNRLSVTAVGSRVQKSLYVQVHCAWGM